ncbi:unnamed protein product [Withania somnifera]
MSLKLFKPLFDSFPCPLQEPDIEQKGVFVSYFLDILALLWFLGFFISNSKKGLPPLPPGPKPLPLIGNLHSLDPELHTYFPSLFQTYGPICRFCLGMKVGIIITSPSLAGEVLKDHDCFYFRFCLCTKAKGAQTINQLFCNQAGSPVNIGEQMFLTMLNVITSMLWGGTVKGEERASPGEFWHVVTDMTELIGILNLSDFYRGLAWFDFQGVSKKMKVLAKRFDKIFENMIEQRQKLDRNSEMGTGVGQESKDFLQVLLTLKDEADAKTPLTMTELKALLMDMVIGGTDTTSKMVEFAMAEIMNKPDILRKLQEELETVVGKDNIVEAVMKETLRIHPVLPLLVPHCPSETGTVGGYTVPKGSRVFINVWAIQRDPSIWKNPTEFHPERFLDNTWDYSGNDFNYFPFGSGRRMCAGIAMAERMFMYSLASFTFDLSEKFGIVLMKKMPLVAIPTPRLSSTTLYE